MHRTRRGLAALAVIAVSALALTGCILPPPVPEGLGEPQWAPTGEQVAPELQQFYGQDVAWNDCGTVWCGTVTAPMDWQDPSAGTIELAVSVAPATGQRQGAILYNPGGPGASGVEYVTSFGDQLLHPDVREHYDLVGFDPRGVGGSTPISCYDDPAGALRLAVGDPARPGARAAQRRGLRAAAGVGAVVRRRLPRAHRAVPRVRRHRAGRERRGPAARPLRASRSSTTWGSPTAR